MAFLDQIWHQFSQEIAQWVRNQWRQTPNMNPSAWVLHLKRRQQLQGKKNKIVIGFETLNIRTHLIWILYKWKLILQANALTFISSTFATFLWLFFMYNSSVDGNRVDTRGCKILFWNRNLSIFLLVRIVVSYWKNKFEDLKVFHALFTTYFHS